MEPYSPKPGKRHNLFILAFRHFPTGLLATAIGIAFLSAPLLYNLFRDNGFDSVFARVLLTGAVIGIVPLSFLYLVTLLRAGKIRGRIETEAEHQLEIITGDLEALQAREKKEEKEVIRLEQVVKGDIKARKVKDEKEDERWDLLNESLRQQNETVELASEERLLVAQQIKDIKDEGEVIRKGLVSDDLEARHVKDLKEDKRWDLLNERLRVSEETGQHNIDEKEEREIARQELASSERILVAQQVKDIKEEVEVARQELASDNSKAQKVKDLKEDERWDLLNERLRVSEETGQQSIDEKEEREIARQELASSERILAAQQVKDSKDERDVARKELASDNSKAQKVKDEKEDERWDLLTESLRLQNETVELASEERLLVAQQVKDIKDEGEVIRKGLVSDDLEARHIRENKDEKRWNALHERLRIQEERSEEREKRQVLRDEEYMRLRHEDELKDQYRTLFARYVRNSFGKNQEVADGLAPIPEAWLKEQPEIRKNPALAQMLGPYNER